MVWWLVGLLGFTLVVWGNLSARQILYPERRVLTPPHPLPPFTTRTLQATDGSSFDVWRLTPASPRGRLLLFHGFYTNRYQVLGIAQALRQRGYEALLFELRGHGSRPGPCTLGVRETDDVGVVLRWLERDQQRALPLGVLGFSIGAAVACQVAWQHPAVVRAVVTDSVYSRFVPIIRRQIKRRYHVPAFPWVWVTWWSVQVALHRRLAPLDPASLAASLRQPLLAIQGGQDQVIPSSFAEEFYRRWAGPKERWCEPAAAHVETFLRYPEEYGNRVAAFFDRTMGEESR